MKHLSTVSMIAALAFSRGALAKTVSYSEDNAGACVTSVASGGGKKFGVGCAVDGKPESTVWSLDASGWHELSKTPATRVAVSIAGTPWIIQSNNTIWKWNGTAFAALPGNGLAAGIAVGATDSDAWAIGKDGATLWRFNGNSWGLQAGIVAVSVAVGGDNVPWIMDGAGTIKRWNGVSFVLMPGCAHAIGGNGWAVGCDGKSVWQYQNGAWTNWWNGTTTIEAISNDGLLLQTTDWRSLIQHITN